MPKPPRPVVAARKSPSQARSTQLVADILAAAIRVLEREGAARFTTTRVASVAGISVGSLYQYFPNKQSILFRLQLDEWETTSSALDTLLGDVTRSPDQRLKATVRAFFHSECEEAPLRLALDAASPDYHDAPESRAHRRRSRRIVDAYVAAAAPRASPSQRALGAELVMMTMSAVGKQLSERRPTRAECERWADSVSEMVSMYLASLCPDRRAVRPPRIRGARATTSTRSTRSDRR